MTNPDLAELVNMLMPYAVERLSETCEFKPVAASINFAGEVTPYIPAMTTARPQIVDSRISRYVFELAASRQIRALCLCREIPFTANSSSGHSAISCEFEDINGNAFNFQLPFQRDNATKSVVFGNLIGKSTMPVYFPTSPRKSKPGSQGTRSKRRSKPELAEFQRV